MGTDYQRIICTSAAVKCLVINVASEVDDSVVAVLDCAEMCIRDRLNSYLNFYIFQKYIFYSLKKT